LMRREKPKLPSPQGENVLDNPVIMGELQYTEKKLPSTDMKQKPKSKKKTAKEAFLTPQKPVKRRK